MSVDKRIIKDCKKNKRRGVEALYKECAGWMLGVARRYIFDRNEAMSVVNIAMLSALKHIATFDENRNEKFEAWIKTILVRKLIDYQRKAEKETRIIDIQEVPYQPVQPYGRTDEALNIQNLKDMINTLPMKTKTVFNLYAIEGYKHKEIAVMLDISEGTSKWHLSDARKKLQMKLTELENFSKNVSV